jgi:hypothetical protein
MSGQVGSDRVRLGLLARRRPVRCEILLSHVIRTTETTIVKFQELLEIPST